MTRWAFEAEPPEDELVTIRVFASQAEHMVARSVLEAADIECFGQDEHAMRISSGLHRQSASHGVTLRVRKSDAEDALAILDAPPLDENDSMEE